MRKIGRYEVESEIGRGTTGIVYLARDPRLDRRVALKTYASPEELTPEQELEFLERFEREARAAAALAHPGIATVYDVDRDPDEGAPYIAMEYVEGESLHELLSRRTKLDPAEACEITEQLAEALCAAHAAGIVHRDVKPANILIRSLDGRVKLADFGVARLRESELTRSGALLGSPAYMSPEQIRGGAIDGRSDLFSLGVILYKMLSGSLPFAGDDLPAVLYSIVHETPVPIHRRVSGLPPGVTAFFDRALAKSPDRRFNDGREFRDALARAIGADKPEPGERTVVAPPPSGDRSSNAAPASLGVGAASAAGRSAPSLDVSYSELPLPYPAPDGRGARRIRLGRLFAIAAGLLLVGATMLLTGDDPAYIEFHARSTVEEGQLTLFIDGREVYRRDLAFTGDRTALTKLLGKLRPAAGGETFEAVIETTPGRHEVEAVLAETESGKEHRSSVVVELEDRGTESLKLIAGRTSGAPVSLKRD